MSRDEKYLQARKVNDLSRAGFIPAALRVQNVAMMSPYGRRTLVLLGASGGESLRELQFLCGFVWSRWLFGQLFGIATRLILLFEKIQKSQQYCELEFKNRLKSVFETAHCSLK